MFTFIDTEALSGEKKERKADRLSLMHACLEKSVVKQQCRPPRPHHHHPHAHRNVPTPYILAGNDHVLLLATFSVVEPKCAGTLCGRITLSFQCLLS